MKKNNGDAVNIARSELNRKQYLRRLSNTEWADVATIIRNVCKADLPESKDCPFEGLIGIESHGDLFDVVDMSNGLKILGYGMFEKPIAAWIANALNFCRAKPDLLELPGPFEVREDHSNLKWHVMNDLHPEISEPHPLDFDCTCEKESDAIVICAWLNVAWDAQQKGRDDG